MEIKAYLGGIEEHFAGGSSRTAIAELKLRRRSALQQIKAELGKGKYFKQLRSELGLNLPLIFSDCIVLIVTAAGMRHVLEAGFRSRVYGQSPEGELRQSEAHFLVDLAACSLAVESLMEGLLRLIGKPEESQMSPAELRARIATMVEGSRELLLSTLSALAEFGVFPELSKVADFALKPVRTSEYGFLAEAVSSHLETLSTPGS